MALSRKRRLWLAFAAIAIGAGSAIVVSKVYPALVPVMSILAVCMSGIFVSGPGRKHPEERATFELRDRIAHRADNTPQAAEKTDTTTTKVRCHKCQHVQVVPVSQKTFSCEQCKA